jgi:hypothetical protein
MPRERGGEGEGEGERERVIRNPYTRILFHKMNRNRKEDHISKQNCF